MSEGIVARLFFFSSLCRNVFLFSKTIRHRLHKKINSVQSVFLLFYSRLWERGYTSLSSLTRLAVSLKLSSVGEKVLGRSLFGGLAGGANGEGSGAGKSPLLSTGFSSFICKAMQTVNMNLLKSLKFFVLKLKNINCVQIHLWVRGVFKCGAWL